MCGILGSVNVFFDEGALNTIRHRGPDDSGFDHYIINDNKVIFAQRRLSIIDLSPAGHQPMNSACNDFSIIFNGEIYNHQELRKNLSPDTEFTGHSDTETILYYLKEFGINGIKDFNGIFSIAFLDKVKAKLYLIRDPFGVKPLYFQLDENNTSISFSSEIRAVNYLNRKENHSNEELATLLRLRYIPAPDTLYNNVKKVRPGHYIEVDLQQNLLQIKNIPFIGAVAATVYYSDKHVVKLYGEKLESAVTRQLLSDVEIGILLSGGIDSALVAAIAQKHYKNKLKAFTIGFEGAHAEDEIDDARETAKLLGLEHYYKRISFPDFLDTIKKCTTIVEEPLATTSIIPMYFLSALAAEKVKVVLSGQGADEPLGGYSRYKLELLREKIPSFLRSIPSSILAPFPFKNQSFLRGVKALGIKNQLERFLSVYELFTIKEINNLISKKEEKAIKKVDYFYNLLNCSIKKHPVERMMTLDSRLNLADDLLNYTDKITMHYSMECRVPILDLELVKFIESLPLEHKLNLKGGKIIHKKFAKEVLPEQIINRKKKAFLSPTAFWFRNEPDRVGEILLSANTAFSKVFNQRFVAHIIKEHQEGYNREKQIFLLLSIYFWLEQPQFSD